EATRIGVDPDAATAETRMSAAPGPPSAPPRRWRDRDPRVVALVRAAQLGSRVALDALDPFPAFHHGVRAPDDRRKPALTHLPEAVGSVAEKDERETLVERDGERLVPRGVAGCGEDPDSAVAEEIMVAVEQPPVEVVLEVRRHVEVGLVRGRVSCRPQLDRLHVDRRVPDELEPARVIEVQVRQHDRIDVLGAKAKLAQLADDISVLVHLDRERAGGAAHPFGEVGADLGVQAGVEQHAALGMIDHVEEVRAVLLLPDVLVERVVDREVGLVAAAVEGIDPHRAVTIGDPSVGPPMTDDVRGAVLGPDEGVSVANPVGGSITVKVRGAETHGALLALETVAASGEGPPLHTHAGEDEFLYVLDGRFQFRLEDEVSEAPAGTCRYIRRGVPHTWRNVTDAPARMLAVFTPAGMEAFFETFAAHAGTAEAPAAFRTLGEAAGMTVVGPPLDDDNRS